ncbi:hypothetical protein OWR28_13020 [Chryseobacterium sp. 1B4]
MSIIFKKRLIIALVLPTAALYYGQSTKDSLEKSKSIDEVMLVGRNLSQTAKERKLLLQFPTSRQQKFRRNSETESSLRL